MKALYLGRKSIGEAKIYWAYLAQTQNIKHAWFKKYWTNLVQSVSIAAASIEDVHPKLDSWQKVWVAVYPEMKY